MTNPAWSEEKKAWSEETKALGEKIGGLKKSYDDIVAKGNRSGTDVEQKLLDSCAALSEKLDTLSRSSTLALNKLGVELETTDT